MSESGDWFPRGKSGEDDADGVVVSKTVPGEDSRSSIAIEEEAVVVPPVDRVTTTFSDPIDRTKEIIATMTRTLEEEEEADDDGDGSAGESSSAASCLCLDPTHLHSFTAVYSYPASVFIPSTYVTALSLHLRYPLHVVGRSICIACGERLWNEPSAKRKDAPHEKDDEEEAVAPTTATQKNWSDSALRCEACGYYAHRSCVFDTHKMLQMEKCSVNKERLELGGAKRNRERQPAQSSTKASPDGLVIVEQESEESASDRQLSSSSNSPQTRSPSATQRPLVSMFRRLGGTPSAQIKPKLSSEKLPDGDAVPDTSSVPNNMSGSEEQWDDVVPTSSPLDATDHSGKRGLWDAISQATSSLSWGQSASTTSKEPSATQKLPPPPLLTADVQESAADKAVMIDSPPLSGGGDVATWTADGPPKHWAESSPQNTHPTEMVPLVDGATGAADDGKEQTGPVLPVGYRDQPFANFSRTLQENLMAYLRRIGDDLGGETDESSTESGDEASSGDGTNHDGSSEEVAAVDDVKDLLKEAKPRAPPPPPKTATDHIADTIQAVRKTSRAAASLGIASVAGGIAGGIAGLAIAGPAGALVGAKCGQTAFMLGVVIEGSVTVGVVVAGVAAAQMTVNQLQGAQNRMLTIGEDGIDEKVVLVRPGVAVDPVWDEITASARRSAPSSSSLFSTASSQHSRKDADIVEANESEIPTEQKVLLLVSRSLNDKTSLPGHVYRYLINAHKDRAKQRLAKEGKTPNTNKVTTDEETKDEQVFSASRERRQDTHGVIKHVTATLLEVRPGFASSPRITEMSATAVESLVFGELYDSVFEEIVLATKDQDDALRLKTEAFASRQWDRASATCGESRYPDIISMDAIKALKMIPDAHSAVDKLEYCVVFLELISKQFSLLQEKVESSSSMGADSLLKMVCQHLVYAMVPRMNAEICFLEEFARDERLLRGKEGYALVTLQASLHFLHSCHDVAANVFDD